MEILGRNTVLIEGATTSRSELADYVAGSGKMGEGTTTTILDVQRMKLSGEKIASVVVWDYQMAVIAERAGADLISVGDSVGVNLWGRKDPRDVTMDEMVVLAKAVRRGVRRSLLSVDFPFGPLQEGSDAAVRAAIRLVKEAGADMVKLDGAASHLEAVRAVARTGIPVWAQFGITPQTADAVGLDYASLSDSGAQLPASMTDELVGQARQLQAAGAVLLNLTNSGDVVGPAVVDAVEIPVLGGFGGGPWLDGRVRMAHAAVGYAASMLDSPKDTYANVAASSFEAITSYVEDVREGRQIRSGTPGR